MSTTDEITEFLAASERAKNPSYKFTTIGDTAKGVISTKPAIVDSDVIGKPGEKKKTMVIALTNDAGETFNLWVNGGQMASAIQEALTTAGASGLEVGGMLAVRFKEEVSTGKPSPMKVYEAQYKAPAAPATDMSELL